MLLAQGVWVRTRSEAIADGTGFVIARFPVQLQLRRHRSRTLLPLRPNRRRAIRLASTERVQGKMQPAARRLAPESEQTNQQRSRCEQDFVLRMSECDGGLAVWREMQRMYRCLAVVFSVVASQRPQTPTVCGRDFEWSQYGFQHSGKWAQCCVI